MSGPSFVFGIPSVCFQPHATRAVRTRHRRGNQREQMAPVVLCAVSLAVAARRLQDTGCPCLTSAPSGASYPTFTLAGSTITYDNGELRVIAKPQTADVSPRSHSLYSGPRYRVMTLSLESATIRPNPN